MAIIVSELAVILPPFIIRSEARTAAGHPAASYSGS
ncbi:hypothetical protein Maes01_01943 [Microbulbifer aestuariivivens]|uniref:Uncharacterized protein n=1 Tax=Microbulbifer aestuariivivens TaxID=1908308 RepID=A0ABP9WQH8_9GAMM